MTCQDLSLGDRVVAQGSAPAPGRQGSGPPCRGRAGSLAGAWVVAVAYGMAALS